MRRQLSGPKAQPVKIAQDAEVAIQIEAAFQVENGCYFAALVDAIYVRCIRGQLNLIVIFHDLLERFVHNTKYLFCFESSRLVFLRYVDREEQRADSTLLGARQIPLAIALPFADVAAMIELAIDRVYVSVEDERRWNPWLSQ